jgi:hypothetical protein
MLIQHLGREGRKQPKIPTTINYDSEHADGFSWGSQKHKNEPLRGIKLLLATDQKMPIYLPASSAKEALSRLGKPAVDVAGDFIGAMYRHAMSRIESTIPVEYLDMCQKQFVLSVPAVWSDKAKDLTMKVRLLKSAMDIGTKLTAYCNRQLNRQASTLLHLSKNPKPLQCTHYIASKTEH